MTSCEATTAVDVFIPGCQIRVVVEVYWAGYTPCPFGVPCQLPDILEMSVCVKSKGMKVWRDNNT